MPVRVATTESGSSQPIIVGVRLRASFQRPMKTRELRREAFQKAFGGDSAKLTLGCPEQVLSSDN